MFLLDQHPIHGVHVTPLLHTSHMPMYKEYVWYIWVLYNNFKLYIITGCWAAPVFLPNQHPIDRVLAAGRRRALVARSCACAKEIAELVRNQQTHGA